MFSGDSLLSMLLFRVPFSMLHFLVDVDPGPLVNVDFVASSLVRDDLEVLYVLDVHFPNDFAQCFAVLHVVLSEGRSLTS